jgi:ribosomal protein S18 acetylase RimI-like enzyme
VNAPPFTIREATPAEYEAVGDVIEAAYWAVGDPKFPDYVDEVRDVARRARDCPILVAVEKGSGVVLGTVSYVPGPGNPYAEVERDGEAGMRMLAVAPSAQGRGIGPALVTAVVERARADGRRGLAINTRPSMVAAHRMYERYGFVRDPARDWEFEPGEWLWALTLRL